MFVPGLISVSEPSGAFTVLFITYGVAAVPFPVIVILVPGFISVSEPSATAPPAALIT